MKKKLVRILSLTLAIVMVFTTAIYLQPGEDNVTYAADEYKEVRLNGIGLIGNGYYTAESISAGFNRVSGMTYTEIYGKDSISFQSGVGQLHYAPVARLTIDISQNETLKRLAQGGASITIEGKTTRVNESGSHYWSVGHVFVVHNGNVIAQTLSYDVIRKKKGENWTYADLEKIDSEKNDFFKAEIGAFGSEYSATATFSPNDKFDIYVFGITSQHGGTKSWAEFTVDVFVNEKSCPTATYNLGFNGGETSTDAYGTPQMLMKFSDPRQYIDLGLYFSEPVYPDAVPAAHTLFNNVPGTGFPRQSNPECLLLLSNLWQWNTSLLFRYTVEHGAYSGSAIPYGGRIETAPYGDISFIEKIKNAGFHDTAGNPLQISNFSGQNLFDTAEGGYNVYVDAMSPTYTKTGNGITPDILTGVTLNKGDSFDFVVTFSEMVRVAKGLNQSKTYLMLSNGDRAYFTRTANFGKQWIFRYTITDNSADTSLLKVIALTNEAFDSSLHSYAKGCSGRANVSGYTIDVDGRCLTDFTGNAMTDRANEDSTTNSEQIESSIQWANISIDNTDPEIDFVYSPYSPVMTVPTEDSEVNGKAGSWGQAGRLFVKATDPDILTPQYDPDQSLSSLMSKGIYRPDMGTGTSGAGLIYYVWSDSATAPDTGVNFEVIKRYSLAGWDDYANEQMNTEGTPYASWKRLWDMGLKLAWTDNYNGIVPPEEFFTSENSGKWYLHVWTADMTWDSARQLMQYDMTKAFKFATNPSTGKTYTTEEMSAIRSDLAAAEVAKGYSNLDAMERTKTAYYQTVYTASYIALLKEFSSQKWMSDDAENYARYKVMEDAGNYGNISRWTADKFRYDDSNWIHRCAEIALDNCLPEGIFEYDAVMGDGTRNVRVPFTLSDAHSGLNTDEIYFQWVVKPDEAGSTRPEETKELNDIDWLPVTSSSITYDAQTQTAEAYVETIEDDAVTDGEYYLSVKVTDNAGNEAVFHSEESFTVNSKVNTACDFSQVEEPAVYYQTVTPVFRVSGLKIGEVTYAVTDSAKKPEETSFAAISSCGEEDTQFDKLYQIPSIGSECHDGVWYVHVIVTEDAITPADPVHFYKAYRLDNTRPSVSISPEEGAIEKTEYQVSISIRDALSGLDQDSLFYEWTTSPTAVSLEDGDWTAITEKETITRKIASPLQNGTWYLHIRAKDVAGNEEVFTSGRFEFKIEQKEFAAEYSSKILKTYTEEDRLYGIAELSLDAEDKAGFRYSVTIDAGESWSPWKPYSSMVEIQLPVENEEELLALEEGSLSVKFRSPYGDVGDSIPIGTDPGEETEVLWMTARLESLSSRSPVNPLAILISKPEDVVVTPVAIKNPGPAVEDEEGDFEVTANGAYYFDITTDGSISAEYCIVVDIFDDVKPEGVITYSETQPTAGIVIASLETSEPVYVKKILHYDSEGSLLEELPGKDRYTFTENGKAEFIFADAAGNENKKTAVVRNIDHDTPAVEIEVVYSDGNGGEYLSYENGAGETISHGLYLNLKRAAGGNGRNFYVTSGDCSTTMEVTKNGTYSFRIQDELGNTTLLQKEVTTIAEEAIEYCVTYRYASEDNAGLDPAENQRCDSVIATVSFKAPADGRQLYSGSAAKAGSAPLASEDGFFIFEHTYSSNGTKTIYFNDGIGKKIPVSITICGIDRTAPTITLDYAVMMVHLPEDGSALSGDALSGVLGGYTVTDKETPDDITVCLTDMEGNPAVIQESGVYTVRYQAEDAAGNKAYIEQTVYALNSGEMYITASGQPLMTSSNTQTFIPTNKVTFMVDKDSLEQMFYRGKKAYNRGMRYDIYYVSGLYREGQMKYIGSKLTSEELTSKAYSITFEKTGWYTIIIRNQERNRIFTSFFISTIE